MRGKINWCLILFGFNCTGTLEQLTPAIILETLWNLFSHYDSGTIQKCINVCKKGDYTLWRKGTLKWLPQKDGEWVTTQKCHIAIMFMYIKMFKMWAVWDGIIFQWLSVLQASRTQCNSADDFTWLTSESLLVKCTLFWRNGSISFF